jgi:succinate dehydrogenase / fumarate reductase, cytochrome b subunit
MSHSPAPTGGEPGGTVTPVATQTQTPALVKGSRAARTTITLKILMAVSGIVFVGFVLTHMYGNLKAFAGHDAFNEYAHHLRTFGEPMLPYEGLLWVIRVGLIVALVVHVGAAYALARRASTARTQKYAVKKNASSSISSRTMRWGGVTILVFLVWHLLNFTIVKINPAGGATNDPYNLMVDTFDLWWMTLIYLLAMVALGLHLHHGTWSALQTLGWTSTAAARTRAKTAGWVLAIVIAGGFSLVPLFVLLGVISK